MTVFLKEETQLHNTAITNRVAEKTCLFTLLCVVIN